MINVAPKHLTKTPFFARSSIPQPWIHLTKAESRPSNLQPRCPHKISSTLIPGRPQCGPAQAVNIRLPIEGYLHDGKDPYVTLLSRT
ncbi:hypothetical protein L484_017169 [Morus notabilis]|uniref:Uncharacterized protein n=1 Tax=Morus notabilis TaxID=981085 RepID=W9RHT9_9ROSA|nr:hypothetical protein L484_017169 [Morus notabilis]